MHMQTYMLCILLPSNEMDTVTRVQSQDEVDCISYRTYTLGKGINQITLSSAMDRYKERLGSLALIREPVLDNENPDLKPVKPCLRIDFVSHSACAEGLVNIHTYTLPTFQHTRTDTLTYIHTHIHTYMLDLYVNIDILVSTRVMST